MSTASTGGWDFSKFKPIDEAQAAPPAAATPAPSSGGWDFSQFKPIDQAASASPAAPAAAARPSVTDQVTNRPGPVSAPTAMEYNQFAPQPMSTLGPVEGPFDTLPAIDQVGRGVKRLAKAVPFQLPASPGEPVRATADGAEVAGGLSDVLGGLTRAAGPLAVAGGLAAPVSAAAALTAGAAGQYVTEKGLDALGVAPGYRDLAGNVTGLLAAYAAGSTRLSPEQTTLVDVLQGKDTPRNNTVDSLRPMVDRGGTLNERQVAQTILKNKYGVTYGPDLSAQPEAPAQAPQQPAAPPAEAPPAAPEPAAPARDIGAFLTDNPIEQRIAGEEKAAIARRAPDEQPPAPPATWSDAVANFKPIAEAQPAAPAPATPAQASSIQPAAEPVQAPETPPAPATWEDAIGGFQPIAEEASGDVVPREHTDEEAGNADQAGPVAPTAEGGAPAAEESQTEEPQPVASEPQSEEKVLEAPPPAEAPANAEPAPPKPGSYANVAPSSLTLDPNRFQFKFEGIGQQGVSDQFKNVDKWNPSLAGTTSVWYDPANGNTYPVNGHHRTQLAQRLGDDNVPEGVHIRYLDAKDARDARSQGALINIGEGNGTALDVAKFMRDTGHTPASMKTLGIELTKKEGRQGAAMANLAEPIWHDAVHGILPVERAVVLGAGLPSQADQTNIYQMMKDREASGKRMTNDQVEELIRMNQQAPQIEKSSEDDGQGDMFGGHNWTQSVLPEKAIASEYVRGQLKAEKKLFGVVSTQAAAEQLGEKGNVIQASTNAQTAEAANQGSVLYDKLSTLAGGPIDQILNSAAERLAKPAKGDTANAAKRDAYKQIRDYLKGQVDKLTAGAASGPGPGAQPQANGDGRNDRAQGNNNSLDAGGAQGDDSGAAGALPAVDAGAPEVTDPHEVQRIRRAIADGEMRLRGGVKAQGERYSDGELAAIQRSVDHSRAKIGELGSDLEQKMRAAQFENERLKARNKAKLQRKPKPIEPSAYTPPEYNPPALSGPRSSEYLDGANDHYHASRMKFEEIPLDATDQTHSLAVVTNPQGMEYIHRKMAGWAEDRAYNVKGMHIDAQSAFQVQRFAKKYGDEYNLRSADLSDKAPPELRHLQALAAAAHQAGQSLVMVVDHAGLAARTRLTALREEIDHSIQSELHGGSARTHLTPQNSQTFISSPEGLIAQKALEHYEFTSTGQAAAEIGVRLMRRDGYQDLGLSYPQARVLGARYVRTLRREHGSVKPREIANRVFDALRRPNSGVAGQPGALPGSVRPEGRGGPAARARTDTTEPDAGRGRPAADPFAISQRRGLDSLASQRPGEPPAAQGDLFGSGVEQESKAADQLHKDRLTHDQLTAQINSGLAKAPTKLNPLKNRGLFDEESPEQGGLFDSYRPPAVRPGDSGAAERDKEDGLQVRQWFTARRDQWSAGVNQEMARLRKIVPDHVDREGLYILRDFRNKPGELKQWLAGTHAGFGDVPRLDIAMDNIAKLKPAIERALNPTPQMLEADKTLTRIAEVSLKQGQALGFIDKHVSPDEYVTHLFDPEGEEPPSLAERAGRAMGGKIGRNFPYNQQRAFPTMLEAIAHNQRPRTLDPFKAFETYGDKFATARATHMLINQLTAAKAGVWGTKNGKGVPQGWEEIAPHAHPFRNMVAYQDEQGEPQAAYQTLFVPKKIAKAFEPITDPDYTNKIAGFTKLRAFQSYTKAAQLGLSFFHAVTENYMALANMGAGGWLKGLKADRDAPGFLEQEHDFIGHGGTTSIQGKTYEAHEGLTLSSLPSAAEAWRTIPGIRHVDQVAQKITDLTFGKLQRQFKVTDYAIHKAAWLAEHPDTMPSERVAAMHSITKEINAVYGGLHQENLGINKMNSQVARALILAPDWTFSNFFNAKYAAEKGTPASKLARMFWLRAVVGGMAATQLMSLALSRKLSKRPTQVHLGTDSDGKEIYQNLFFKGAPGDLANLIGNIKDFGAVDGLARTLGNKAAPVLRTVVQALATRDFMGREIVPHGMNPIAGTVRGAYEAGKSVAPIPWSLGNLKDMLFGPDSHKYKIPLEVLTTLLAGTPPTHVTAKPEKESQSIIDQITSGKVAAPGQPRTTAKPPNPLLQMKRQQRDLLHPRQ